MVAAGISVADRSWCETKLVGCEVASDGEHGLTEHAHPAQVLDQAFALLRHASAAQWVRGGAAALPLAAVLLALYACVHVLGVRPPFALFGLLCALAYWARFRALSALARELVSALAPRVPLGERATGLFNTAMIAGIGSWCWAAALVGAAQSSLTLLFVCLPLLCMRGAFAPSLLARAACAPEVGLQALARASADTRGQRTLFLGVELLVLLGLLLLFGNLYALTALVLLVASSVLGLDVGFVTALIAPDNEIVPLLLLGLAALVLEPLRAAISALAYQSARERLEGADLGAMIAALGEEPPRRVSLQPKAAARALLVLLIAGAPALVHAQPSAAARDARGREYARRLAGARSCDARAEDVRGESARAADGAARDRNAGRAWARSAPADVRASEVRAQDRARGASTDALPRDARGREDARRLAGARSCDARAEDVRGESARVADGTARARNAGRASARSAPADARASDVRAQDRARDAPAGAASGALADVGAGDARARERARAILARAEFLPSGMDSGRGAWREWFTEHWREPELPDRDASAPPRFELQLPPSLLVLGSTVLLFCVGFWLTRSAHRRRARAAAAVSGTAALPTREQRIAEASQLAEQGQYERSLRSLYAACLSVLGRVDSAHTNGQVLQQIRSQPLKAAFATFTQIIEPCCYGGARATRADFVRARALTEEILRGSEASQ